jgi:UDP-N-acetylmuramoylalanine--D-glutamate ligase
MIRGKRVTVMGLGLHGGGLASARFCAARGAEVVVTDLKDRKTLSSTIEQLKDFSVRFVLGRHEEADFIDTDLVIKNPGVPVDSHYLALAHSHGVPVKTDISLFFEFSSNPLIAVTGSKGKSTTASVIHFGLASVYPDARLGGNITVSPLTFIDDLKPGTPVVLELSSWQLADLAGDDHLKPKVSMITNILPDHMNRYRDMDEYVKDKKIIYSRQDGNDWSIFNRDDPYTREFEIESKAKKLFFSRSRLNENLEGCWLEHDRAILRCHGKEESILMRPLKLAGEHNRLNCAAAALALTAFGVKSAAIDKSLPDFPGIEHRLEFFSEKNGIRFINDSAATIPHAVTEAVKSIPGNIILITGGTDKNIDFTPFEQAASVPRRIILLQGSATDKIITLLLKAGIPFYGPFPTLEEAVSEALGKARAGDTVLFSPGCASFGLFQNEFERGRRFKKIISTLSF